MAASLQKLPKDTYLGDKKNHLRDGYGVYTFANKFFRYDGQWKEGRKHGHGKLSMRDGSFYEGEFKNGEIEGHGFRYWGVSRDTYAGEFLDGECHGQGTMRYSDGSTYEGSWYNNKRQGIGRLTYEDGSVYEGNFHEHKRHGDGKMFYIDGGLYEGDWIQDKRQGSGIMKFSDGSVYDGQWRSDLFNGEGTILHSSGFMYEGIWINGKPAVMASKLSAIGVDGSNMVVHQGQPFEIKVETQTEDGTPVADHGRELKIGAGYRHYTPKEHKREPSSLFDTIEDFEDSPILTPFGYSIVPYPLTELHQDLLDSLAKADTFVSEDEASDERGDNAEDAGEVDEAAKVDPATKKEANSADQSAAAVEAEKTETSATMLNTDAADRMSEDLLSPAPYGTRRTVHGQAVLSNLFLAAPPPLYRPYALQDDDTASSAAKAKAKAAKPSASASKPVFTEAKGKTPKSTAAKQVMEKYPRLGDYVIVIEDVTNPPFMGVTLPTLYLLIHLKKKKRITNASKLAKVEKTLKWDTSKHIQQSIASHRESSILRELTSSIDAANA